MKTEISKMGKSHKQGWLLRNCRGIIYPFCMIVLVMSIAMAAPVGAVETVDDCSTIEHVADSSNDVMSTNMLEINPPAGTQVGDLLIANLFQWGNDACAPAATEPGWTWLSSGAYGLDTRGSVLWKVADASDASGGATIFAIYCPFGGYITGTISAFRGVDTSDPFDAIGTHSSEFTNYVYTDGITTTNSNTMLVFLAEKTGSDGIPTPWSTGIAGVFTQIYNYGGTYATGSVGAAILTMAVPGLTGNGVTGYGSWQLDGAILIALKPYCGGGTEPTTTTVITSGSPSTYGSSVTFTATVTSGTPTGNVDFMYGGTDCSDGTAIGTTQTLDGSGQASVSTSTLVVGTYTIRACYLGDGAYDPSSGTVTQVVDPKNLTISGAVAQNKVYDGTTDATVDFSSASLAVVESGDTVSIDSSGYAADFDTENVGNGKPVTVTGVILSGADAANYTVSQPSGLTANITPRDLTVTATVADKVYNTTTAASVTLSSNKVSGDNVDLCYTTATFPSADVGTYTVTVSGISICGGTDAPNYNLLNTTDDDVARITPAPTTTIVTVDPTSIEWMDRVDFQATISSGALPGPFDGTVALKVGSITYGTVPVVAGVADLGDMQIANMPTFTYTVTATFVSSNPNYSGSSGTTSLDVDPRTPEAADAFGFYTGDDVAWTTGQNSNTATVKLAATIIDNNPEEPGDVTQATVTFLLNGVPIPGAQNLPVGLVDPDDPTVGVAAAIVQFNKSKASNSEIFIISVDIGGAYDEGGVLNQAQVMIVTPVPGGRILGTNAVLANKNAAGYLGSNPSLFGVPLNFSVTAFDISYNKSLRNPQGKLSILLTSLNNVDGEQDRPVWSPHVYLFTSNSIALLSKAGNKAVFSAKCNVKELVGGTWVSIEGNAKLDVTMTDLNPVYPSVYDTLGLTLYKSKGGLWFSSNWNGAYTLEQNVFFLFGRDQLTVR